MFPLYLSFSFYTGRVIIDAFIIFWFLFLIGNTFLAIMTLGLIGFATFIKTKDIDLFQELFRDGGGVYSNLSSSGGGGDDILEA